MSKVTKNVSAEKKARNANSLRDAEPPEQPPILNGPGKIRIVGGLWKRTPIVVPAAPGLRPTPDRVRESLFNWIGPAIRGTRCLDLFAGSGALGLEALSRGASHVHFNETQIRATQAISALLARLQRPPDASWELSTQDALALLTPLRGRADRAFDLVFLDPPFRQGWLEKILPPLLACLTPDAKLYIEAESAFDHPELELQKSGKAGQVHYHLFQRRQP